MSKTYEEARALAETVELPPEGSDELRTLALEVICSKGVPSHLTPYGSIRARSPPSSTAAFAIGARDDAFYRDGEVLLGAALAKREREATA